MTDDAPASVIKTPYTKDEQRIADFLRSINSVAGKDPIGELIEECTSLNRLFEMIYAANKRGIVAWRAKNPGNDLVLPDQGKLVEWLLDELSKANEDSDALTEGLQEIRQWCDAYPVTVFLELSPEQIKRADQVLKDNGLEIGALHAQWARHILKGISDIVRREGSPTSTPPK